MKHSALLLSAVLVLGPALSGCSSETMPDYSILQSLRVIALKLDLPEIEFNAGAFSAASVNLTPVISDLYGGGRSLTYRLYHCLDPGVGIGAPPSCDGNPTLTQVSTGTAIGAIDNEVKSPNFTGSLTPISIPLNTLTPSVMAVYASRFASLTSAQAFNGIAVLIFFELFPTGDEGSKITTFKRLVLSGPSKTVKNQNPSGLDFKAAGLSLSALPGTETPIEATLAGGSVESYSLMNSDGSLSPQTETIETAWFFTGPADIPCSKKKECTPDGLFSLSRTLPGEFNRFTPPSVALPVGRGRVLLGVAKDERGGVTLKRLVDGPDS